MNRNRTFWITTFFVPVLGCLLFTFGIGVTGLPTMGDDPLLAAPLPPSIDFWATPVDAKYGETIKTGYLNLGGPITSCVVTYRTDTCTKCDNSTTHCTFTAPNEDSDEAVSIVVFGPGGGSDTDSQVVHVTEWGYPPPPTDEYDIWSDIYTISLFETPSDVDTFRQYRDQFLGRTARGKFYTDLLYENSEAALRVLVDHPDLMARAKDLLQANREGILQVLNGKRPVVARPGEIVAFLDDFAARAPVTLKALARIVKRDMLRKFSQGKPFIGFMRKR